MIDVERTIISQYANSPIIVQMIQDMNQWIDQSANIDAFYKFVWDIDTAQGYGLDVWGRIVGITRVLRVPTLASFGFGEAGTFSANPFNQGVFYSGGGTTSNYMLPDDSFRALILAKALHNISECSIGAINQILLNLFPDRGNCYCTDGLNMTMTYTFKFSITAVEIAIISQSGVLPRPSGVQSSISVL